MPKNANHGISALHVFVALVNAYGGENKPIDLYDLKRILSNELHEYFTDGRSISAKKAVKKLAEYALIDERKNLFGFPVSLSKMSLMRLSQFSSTHLLSLMK